MQRFQPKENRILNDKLFNEQADWKPSPGTNPGDYFSPYDPNKPGGGVDPNNPPTPIYDPDRDGKPNELPPFYTNPDTGYEYYPDGRIVAPDGTVFYPDGTEIHPSGVIFHPDGTITTPDGLFGKGSSGLGFVPVPGMPGWYFAIGPDGNIYYWNPGSGQFDDFPYTLPGIQDEFTDQIFPYIPDFLL